MNTCKTCKWWRDSNEDEYSKAGEICHPFDQDTCKEMKMPFEVRVCKCPNITYFERNPDSKGITLIDGSEYFAAICSGPNFGCTNWERKE